jgi:hypothetical protein
MSSDLHRMGSMLKFTLLVLLAATSVSGCAYCPATPFHGCGGPVDPVYAPFAPMPR